MKNKSLLIGICLLMTSILAFTFRSVELPYGMAKGTPEIKSITSLAFGPEGVLFLGDSKSASVFAINTKDNEYTKDIESIDLKGIDKKLADRMGTTVDNISILDIAVNPTSKKVYMAVQAADGTPVLLKLEGDQMMPVSLEDVEFASVELNNSPAEDAKDGRGRSLRVSSISDLGYSNGKLLVSGLSNQEFSSTFRSIPFPFTDDQDFASLEIFHAAHGRYETTSPIKTFTTAEINGKEYLVASYTCTPLVLFPMDDLTAGKHIKGRTIAEMGSGNQPLDILNVEKDGKSYLVMANSNRPVFRVNFEDIESFEGSLTEPVPDNFATEGVDFVSMPLTNVQQLDKMDDGTMIILQRKSNGSLDLWSTDKAEYLLR
ncbi:hypothetical protein [Algoriphagus machipongonensis]|uniref:Uncharacterized protein n=1 Tax=Algoriphagus machipongonensis TaxID=388413 RepID=A3HSY8_9BACT|nr:hypothetical protein [Algoriphagus machipongonensis]EAZ82956.2 hypothetical protein ALPR1_12085 [Algoriphagus machipongonensis]